MVRSARQKLGDDLARQVHEEFLEFLDEACLDGIWYFGLEDDELWHSRRHPTVLGLDGQTLPGDMSWWAERMHPDDFEESQNQLAAVAADPSHPYDCTMRLRHRDGHWVWIRARAKAKRGADGKLRLLGANLDITHIMERKQALEEMNRELEAMAKILAHDLKQPLRNVSTYLGLLERETAGELSPQGHAFLQAAVGASTQMSRMLSDVLTLSSLREAPAAPVDLADAITEARYNVSLEGTIEMGDVGWVMGHRGQLVRAFQNLLGNAAKYRSAERPLAVSIRATTSKAGEHCIEVQDNGIGFSPDHSERIFELFSRLDPEASEGSGIGLAVVRRVMSLHHGGVSAKAQPDVGATFTLVFPVGGLGPVPKHPPMPPGQSAT